MHFHYNLLAFIDSLLRATDEDLLSVMCLMETKYHFGYTRFNYVYSVPYSYLTVIFVKKSKNSVYML